MNTENNPYQTPQSNVEQDATSLSFRYMGFWARVAASIVDQILMMVVTIPLLLLVYGDGSFMTGADNGGILGIIISYVLPPLAIILFWTYKQATPGKMLFSTKIVDAKTGEKPTIMQWVIRYIGYIPSALILGLGFFWVIWDKRKQGWHDKMAGTLVVYKD